MARKKTGRPAGRPFKPTGPAIIPQHLNMNQPQVINWKKVDEYLESGANGFQIAAKLNIHHDTLYNCCQRDHNILWTEYSHNKKLGGDADLHWLQMSSARRGNTQILLKLGELRLGQAEVKEQLSPFEDATELRHKNMILEDKIAKLEAALNADKPKTE